MTIDDYKLKIEELENKLTTTQIMLNNLQEENKRLTNARYSLDRVELEERIDKAIEYIEHNLVGHIDYIDMVECTVDEKCELLKILKGEDNESN